MTSGTTTIRNVNRPNGTLLTKIDRNGQFFYTKLIAELNSPDVQSPNIAVGPNEILIEDVARDTLVIGSTMYSKPAMNKVFYVMKLSLDGTVIWSKFYFYSDPLQTGAFGGIVTDRKGGAYVTTNFRNTLEFEGKQLINSNSWYTSCLL